MLMALQTARYNLYFRMYVSNLLRGSMFFCKVDNSANI